MVFGYGIFCKNLKVLRKAAGYNKFQMSIQANINYQYYCNIENGNRIPNFKTVISIANALKISISQLLNCVPLKDSSVLELSVISKLKSISDDTDLLIKLYEVLIALKTQGEEVERIQQ